MERAAAEGFFDELEKIARKKKEKEYSLRDKLIDTNTGMLAGAGVTGLSSVAKGAIVGDLMDDMYDSGLRTSADEVQALRNKMGVKGRALLTDGGIESAFHLPKGGMFPKIFRSAERAQHANMGLPPELSREALEKGLSFAPRKSGAHFMAHELGHAKLRNSGIGRAINKIRLPGMVAGTLVAPGMAAFSDTEGATSKLSPLVGVAGAAPMLADEAYASLKGYGAMKRMGTYSPQALRTARRQLGKAFGTYGTLGAAMIASPFAIRAAKKWRKKRALERAGNL